MDWVGNWLAMIKRRFFEDEKVAALPKGASYFLVFKF